MFYTYIYFNPETDVPFYVGKGKDDRANTHIKGLSSGNKYAMGRIRNLRAKGIEPTVEIIHTTNETAAFWLERCFIAAYGRKDLGTGSLQNKSDGGEGATGRRSKPMSQEQKELRRRRSLEVGNKPPIHRGNTHPMFGKSNNWGTHSDAAREKIRQAKLEYWARKRAG
jgi:hypothetical protein